MTLKKSKGKVLNKYHKVFKGVGKYNKDQVFLFINDKVPPVAQKTRRIPYKTRESKQARYNRSKI